jgi:hypothetical protein
MTTTETAASTQFVPDALHVHGDFEVSGALYDGGLRGDIYGWAAEVDGIRPTRIVRVNHDFIVNMHWLLSGELAQYICGTWCCTLHFESVGAGVEFNYPPQNLEQHFIGCNEYPYNHYSCAVRVPAGTIDPNRCGSPYVIAATVQYLTDCGKPGPMIGCVEIRKIAFYQP